MPSPRHPQGGRHYSANPTGRKRLANTRSLFGDIWPTGWTRCRPCVTSHEGLTLGLALASVHTRDRDLVGNCRTGQTLALEPLPSRSVNGCGNLGLVGLLTTDCHGGRAVLSAIPNVPAISPAREPFHMLLSSVGCRPVAYRRAPETVVQSFKEQLTRLLARLSCKR